MKIAIQGHPTRGEEVKRILEMITNHIVELNCGTMFFMDYMVEFCNRIVTISNVNSEDKCYDIEEDDAANGWTDEMIEGLAEEETPKFKVNDLKYPKTYEECCKVLFPNSIELGKVLTSGYNCELLKKFGELLICRNAYWKIAGEEMGLDKPWEPNYDSGANKYGIICMNRVVQKSNPTTNWERHLNKVLDFPTSEMRDAFYENFKDLIELCKELL